MAYSELLETEEFANETLPPNLQRQMHVAGLHPFCTCPKTMGSVGTFRPEIYMSQASQAVCLLIHSAVAEVAAEAYQFAPQVVFRQVIAASRALWEPIWSARWNNGFPALYTSLELDVASAERTRARPVQLLVGLAVVTVNRTLDLGFASPCVSRP